ncbi:MAG: hypothetical protein JWN70_4941 [Planctomycetaceae bacterium]|nr:hypothetical protein [Planctomycetaceae bacterium]
MEFAMFSNCRKCSALRAILQCLDPQKCWAVRDFPIWPATEHLLEQGVGDQD